MRFDKGYISGYFVTDAERQEAVLEDRTSCSCRRRCQRSRICFAAGEGHPVRKPLLIIAEDVEARRCPPWWSTRSAHLQVCGRQGPRLR